MKTTKGNKIWLFGFLFIVFALTMFLLGIDFAKVDGFIEKETAINCLRGKNPYYMEIIKKMHIIDNKDTLYSVDTLFVKKIETKKL